ncbi:acyltransferase family protein [Priestia sp. YIM B13446]|uniref:acyltransferase family protein n=1 Tax=unclassified Priestia TaxID=2800374 RepID=UPI00366B21C9
MKLSKDTYFDKFSIKVTLISFIMSIFVIYIHANNLAYYGIENDFNSMAYKIEQVVGSGIGGIAVPFFFMMAGYWFFRFDLDKVNISQIISTKLKKKIFTLLIPYVLWNSFGMIFYMLVPRIPIFGGFMNGEAVEINMENTINGIFLHANYFTFWYLRDLILLTFLTPFFAIVLKSKKVSIVILIAFSLIEMLGVDLIVFNTKSSLFFFFSGCFISTFYRDIFERTQNNKVGIISFLIFILLIVIRLLDIRIFSEIMYMISPLFLWFAFDVLQNIKKIRIQNQLSWFKHQSFFIYAVHIIPVTIIGKVFLKVRNTNNSQVWIIASYVLVPIITLLVIYFVAKFLNRYCKRFYKLICGNRG